MLNFYYQLWDSYAILMVASIILFKRNEDLFASFSKMNNARISIFQKEAAHLETSDDNSQLNASNHPQN